MTSALLAYRLAVVVATVCACLGAAPHPARAHVGIDEYERATRDDVAREPRNADAHLNRARVHQMAHRFDAALAELDEAEVRGADRDVVGTMKGEVYLEADWPRMASRELDRVLVRRPEAYGALFLRGRARLALGDGDAAARDMGDAIAGLAAPQPEQVIARRDVLLTLGRKDDAVRALDEGMARLGRVPSLQLPAIDLEVELGRYDRALERIDALTRTAPQNPMWVARRGEILDKAGRGDEARIEYAKALSLLDQRPRGRHAAPFEELRRRLKTALESNVAQQRQGQHMGDSR